MGTHDDTLVQVIRRRYIPSKSRGRVVARTRCTVSVPVTLPGRTSVFKRIAVSSCLATSTSDVLELSFLHFAHVLQSRSVVRREIYTRKSVNGPAIDDTCKTHEGNRPNTGKLSLCVAARVYPKFLPFSAAASTPPAVYQNAPLDTRDDTHEG